VKAATIEHALATRLTARQLAIIPGTRLQGKDTFMITIKHRLGFIGAAMVAMALAGCSSGESQMAAAPMPPPTAAPPPAMPAPAPAPKPMSHQQLIQAVQTALNSNGAKLTVDGRMGPKTAAALRSYQRQHSLKVTGQPDAATLKALGIQG
jgi:glucose/arabinose dehydrogenase